MDDLIAQNMKKNSHRMFSRKTSASALRFKSLISSAWRFKSNASHSAERFKLKFRCTFSAWRFNGFYFDQRFALQVFLLPALRASWTSMWSRSNTTSFIYKLFLIVQMSASNPKVNSKSMSNFRSSNHCNRIGSIKSHAFASSCECILLHSYSCCNLQRISWSSPAVAQQSILPSTALLWSALGCCWSSSSWLG